MSIVLSAVIEMVPPQVLVASFNVPPCSTKLSPATVTPAKSSVAPLAKVVPPAALPKPVLLATTTVPELMMVSPVKLLSPLSVITPAPLNVKPKLPVMSPDSVRLEPAPASIVLSAVSAMSPANTPLRMRPPATVTASCTLNSFRSSVPPAPTVVPLGEAVAPSAWLWPSFKVPAFTWVVPV